jgi:hypothetical protein
VKRQLAPIFGDDLPLTLLYVLLDRRSGAFHFDTLGDAPRPLRVRHGETSVVSDGMTLLESGDILVVHTEGLLPSGISVSDVMAGTAHAPEQDVTTLLETLAKSAERTERTEEDDPRSWTVTGISRAAEVAR